jgi:hypothetical protein
MPTRSEGMDNGGTVGFALAASVDLRSTFCYQVPTGVSWVAGVRTFGTRPNQLLRDVFLVPERGQPWTEAELPSDLHLRFAELVLEPAAILKFAEQYGCLTLIGSHFHPDDDPESNEGDALSDWCFEITRHKLVQELWQASQERKNPARVQRLINAIPAINETWSHKNKRRLLAVPVEEIKDPFALARDIAILTINSALSCEFYPESNCTWPGCGARPHRSYHDFTQALLRYDGHSRPELVVIPSNLSKALWLQSAGMVAAQRIVKKCEAPDCGRYMDVTMSQHPSACRMHSWCAERLRKRRYRARQKLN